MSTKKIEDTFDILNQDMNIKNSDDELCNKKYDTLDIKKWRHVDILSQNTQKYKNFSSCMDNDMYSNNNFNKKKIIQKDFRDEKNINKLLCNNIVTTGYCIHGDRCLFAHSLSEQKIDEVKKHAHDILFSNDDLSYINFQQNLTLYKSLLLLTKFCDKDKCTGGYNCKYGVCGDKKTHICLKDLNYGDCNEINCNLIHLTKRNLKPFYHNYNKKNTYDQNNICDKNNLVGTKLSNDFFNDSGVNIIDVLQKFKNSNTFKNDDEIISVISTDSYDSNESICSVISEECKISIFDENNKTLYYNNFDNMVTS